MMNTCGDIASGNTSACAEKSLQRDFKLLFHRKYLRVRGEEPRPTIFIAP